MRASSDGSGSPHGAASAALAIVLVLIAGCAGQPRDDLLSAAARAGFRSDTLRAGEFEIAVLTRVRRRGDDLVVYIEGDGYAWRSRRMPSRDPTPRNPLAMRLALADPSPAVLYIARPCQYLGQAAECGRRYWTSHRYSETVITTMSTVLDALLQRYGNGRTRLGLVGYSGGGVIAALLAAQRNDVAWLVTVAGNLDHRAWTEFHGVSPLTGSLELYDAMTQLRTVPQVHLSGADDDIVPPDVVASFRRQLPEFARASFQEVAGFDHRCCWADQWPTIACAALRDVNVSIAGWCR